MAEHKDAPRKSRMNITVDIAFEAPSDPDEQEQSTAAESIITTDKQIYFLSMIHLISSGKPEPDRLTVY